MDSRHVEMKECAAIKAADRARAIARVRKLLAEGLTQREVVLSTGRSAGFVSGIAAKGGS